MVQIAVATNVSPDTLGNGTKSTQAEAPQCIRSSYDIGEFWNDRFRADAETLRLTQAGSFLRVPSINSGDLAPYRNKYYGSFIRDHDAPAPTAYRFRPEPEKVKRKHAEWERLKASGEIVLSPMLAHKADVVVQPGIRKDKVRTWLYGGVRHDQLFTERYPPASTGCRNWPNRPYDVNDAMFYSTIPGTTFTYTRYSFGAGSDLHIPVSARDVREWFTVVSSEIRGLETSGGLVAEARSEAAAGLLDLSTTLAEAPETLKAIFEALRLILVKYLEVRRRVSRMKSNDISSGNLASDIANVWMQYRYGIMPNVYTIQDGLEYLSSELVKYQSVRVGSQDFQMEIPPLLESWSGDISGLIHRVFLKNRFALQDATKKGAFLRTNLLVTSWELIPLSFVIDWVLNVGDFLSSLSKPNYSVQEACLYSWQVRDERITLTNPDFIGGDVIVDLSFYRADVIQPTSHIGLQFRPSMNYKRVLDALALLWGRTSGDFKRNLNYRRH